MMMMMGIMTRALQKRLLIYAATLYALVESLVCKKLNY